MECHCGGATTEATAKNNHYVLAYAKCGACGRIGGEYLYAGSSEKMLAQVMDARYRCQISAEAK